MTGAGDVKLCSVMAAFMGIPDFAECFLYSLLFGSIFSFFICFFTAVCGEGFDIFWSGSDNVFPKTDGFPTEGSRTWTARFPLQQHFCWDMGCGFSETRSERHGQDMYWNL